MRALAIAASLWMCVDCNANAADILAKCRPLAEPIHLAATEHRVPVLLLTALVFAESSCDPTKVNPVSGAIGASQLLITGAGAGYTKVELLDPWRNTMIAAAYLATWKRKCGSWRGAVRVYNGLGKCRGPGKFADKVIAMWKRLERQSEPIT
jgi:hypothetical protein